MKTEIIKDMNRLCRDYDGINKMLVQMKNRLNSTNPNANPDHDLNIQAAESIKGRISRQIEKYCQHWPVYSEWLEKIRGVGPFISGNLILLYYYRFTPICTKCGEAVEKKDGTFLCPKCEKPVKGDGIGYRIDGKDFSCVSAWWSYMGRGIVDGKMPKRKKGVVSSWSQRGRMVGFQFADQMNRQTADHPYKAFLLERKKKREKTHPKATKGHRLNMAKNETCKLFLSHFWHVARELEGKSTEGPYAEVVLKHTGIIAPYFWEPRSE